MTNIIMKSKDRILFDVVIRQDTKDSFLSLSDLNEAYIRAREINGWAEKDLNHILQRDSNVERIYYIIREQIFSEVDKTTKTSFYENYPDYISFKKVVDEIGLPKVLKQLHLYRMTGRGENRKVMCNSYIWVLVAKEMYEAADVCRDTFNQFLSDVKNAMSKKPDSSCKSSFTTEKCITGAHNTKYYHPKVEEAINAGWKTAKEMYEAAYVGERTWRRFMADVKNAMSEKPNSRCFTDDTANLVVKLGSSHKAYYHPKVEEAFQLWLKKNAMNAGGQRTEGSIIKQDNQKDLFIGCVATKGTPAEKRSLAQHLMEMADQQELLEQTNQQNQQLQLENQSMRNTLQYDKVKGWYRWSDLKRDWKPHCDRLKKGNYETIFYEAGLEYGKDYEEITFSGYEFPTCMVSPTAVPKLISYLHIF